jgi:hypothetical protein
VIGPRNLWRIHPAMRGVLAYLTACLFVYGFLYYGQFRYRIPMEPLMILVATPMVTAVLERRASLREVWG